MKTKTLGTIILCSAIPFGASLAGARAGKWLLFAYYGDSSIERDPVIDANGKLAGYGYAGSSHSQNKTIEAGTMGGNETLGATHDSTIFLDVRRTLPGSMPAF